MKCGGSRDRNLAVIAALPSLRVTLMAVHRALYPVPLPDLLPEKSALPGPHRLLQRGINGG